MSIYKYRARKGPQQVVEGRLEAQSEDEAIDKISQLGYFPIHLEVDTNPIQPQTGPSVIRHSAKAKRKEVTIFIRQLAILLKSGVPILTTLTIIGEQSNSVSLKEILCSIHDAVKEGASFSSTLQWYPKVFSSLDVAMVRAGEDSGALPEALFRIADYHARQEEMISRFRTAMAYPILMGIVGFGTVVFMLVYVMPRLMNIFVSIGQDLPLPTKMLLSLSTSLRQWWPWAILMAAIVVIRQELKTKIGRRTASLFKLYLPIFGKLILKNELARFCRTLELLLHNGIPILKALEVAAPVVNNEIIRDQLREGYKVLEQGGSFGRSIKDSKLFPVFMSNLLIVGEESGKLMDALSEVATSYEHDTDEAIKVMSSLLEPLMILGMGIIVGFIVVAMLLPIFEINVMAR
ncbi:MAG: type II secretion system F family protein [Candidatus Omnitrophica bacterium]|nr:type II secretion system F family protein [Candidatus Omnitrophota bacterium]